MNEKLKQEIRKFCNENVTGYNPIYTGNSLTYSMLPKCAEHFYNLAIREVRKKVEKQYRLAEQEFMTIKSAVNSGYVGAYLNVLDIIDDLTK